MRRALFFPVLIISALLLAGCRAPAPQIMTPVQTAAGQAALTPTTEAPPTPVTETPAPISPSSWPVMVAQADLDIAYDPELYPMPLALDPAGGQIYVSGAPSQTFVLSARDLSVQEALGYGGNLALDAVNNRLLVGARNGLAVYNKKSGSQLAQITLAQPRESSGAAVPDSRVPALPLTIPSGDSALAAQAGLYRVSALGLYASDVLTQPRDIRDLALDEKRNVLYASINNGIPGSNNLNDLWAIDLRARQSRLLVPGISDLAFNPARDQLIVTLSERYGAPGALQIWERQPLTLTRSLHGLTGQLAVDGARDRLYVLSAGRFTRLMVLELGALAVVADVALSEPYAAMALDAPADRLYLLSVTGRVLAMSGHGGQAPAAAGSEPVQPPQSPVTRLVVSPDFARDQTLFGLWGNSPPRGGTLLTSRDGGATWRAVSGGLPDSSIVTDLAFSPSFAGDHTLFAATQRGVYRSHDGGQTWQPASAGLSDVWVTQLALSPAFPRDPIVYAQTYLQGLHRSTDGGENWISLARRYEDFSGGQKTHTLALSPDFERDRTIFLSTVYQEGQLIVSHDGGETWTRLVGATIYALYPSPGFAQDHTLWGMFDRQGLLRSTDGGKTWSGALRGVSDASKDDRLALSPDFARDHTALLLARNSGQLYRTTDGGNTWQVNASPPAIKITALAIFGQTAWLGASDGSVTIMNMGSLPWSPSRSILPADLDAIALSPAYAQDSALFVASKTGGVWMSADGGQTWNDTGFPAREVGAGRMHLAISPDWTRDRTLFAATSSQLYRTTDGGQTWQALPIGPGQMFPINALAVSPNYARDRALALAGDYRAPTIVRSTDGGDTWQADAAGLPGAGSLNHLAFSPNFALDRGVYVWAESNGLYRSGDGGQTWTRVYQPAGSWLIQSFALSPDFGRDRLMFLGTLKENHNVYRSADGGASWHPAELGLPLELLWASALAVSPDFGRDRTLFLGTDRGVYRSTDGGQMWRQMVDLPEVVALALAPGAAGDYVIFAISTRAGLYVSADSGERWSPLR